MKYKFKFIVALFVLLYIVITALVFNFYRELALKDTRREAFYILDTMNAVRDYVSTVQRPLINELKEKKLLSEDFFDPRLMSSTYITREIYKIQLAKNHINYDYKLVATDPLNPEHAGSEFENEILEGFKENRYKEYSRVIYDKEGASYLLSLPITNSQSSCTECHSINAAPKKMQELYGDVGNFKGGLGDTIAMISFRIPIKSILLYHTKEFVVSGLSLLMVFLICIFCIYKIHKKNATLKMQTQLLLINQSRLALMGEMIGNISHQWRQPLSQISSTLINLELYNERGKLSKERLEGGIKDAGEQVKFMSDTIEDFKNFFNPNMPKKEFSAGEAIEQARKILNASLKKHVIDISVRIEENFTLYGNVNELIQVLINIINNAKEAFLDVPLKRREIKIRSFLKQGERVITIENNASRIDEARLDKIFEPHFTTKQQGSGLGLYMSKMIIEKNGGSISAANSDDGAIFTIAFR